MDQARDTARLLNGLSLFQSFKRSQGLVELSTVRSIGEKAGGKPFVQPIILVTEVFRRRPIVGQVQVEDKRRTLYVGRPVGIAVGNEVDACVNVCPVVFKMRQGVHGERKVLVRHRVLTRNFEVGNMT